MQWSPSGYSTAVGRALPTWPARGPGWDAPGGSTSRLTVAATSGSAAAPSPASRETSLSSLSRRARGCPAPRERECARRNGRSPRLEGVAPTGEQNESRRRRRGRRILPALGITRRQRPRAIAPGTTRPRAAEPNELVRVRTVGRLPPHIDRLFRGPVGENV